MGATLNKKLLQSGGVWGVGGWVGGGSGSAGAGVCVRFLCGEEPTLLSQSFLHANVRSLLLRIGAKRRGRQASFCIHAPVDARVQVHCARLQVLSLTHARTHARHPPPPTHTHTHTLTLSPSLPPPSLPPSLCSVSVSVSGLSCNRIHCTRLQPRHMERLVLTRLKKSLFSPFM